jgi:hypothetical protein
MHEADLKVSPTDRARWPIVGRAELQLSLVCALAVVLLCAPDFLGYIFKCDWTDTGSFEFSDP